MAVFEYVAKVSSGLFRRDTVTGDIDANDEHHAMIRVHNLYAPSKTVVTKLNKKSE